MKIQRHNRPEIAVGTAVAVVLTGSLALAVLLMVLGLAAGALLVLPVGGADVPIVISLLNAFTGLAVAASGVVLGNVLLVVAVWRASCSAPSKAARRRGPPP